MFTSILSTSNETHLNKHPRSSNRTGSCQKPSKPSIPPSLFTFGNYHGAGFSNKAPLPLPGLKWHQQPAAAPYYENPTAQRILSAAENALNQSVNNSKEEVSHSYQAPPSPARISAEERAIYNQTPLIRSIRNMISNLEAGRPFTLSLRGEKIHISQAKLLGKGKNDNAYLCTTDKGIQWVIKVPQTERLNHNPREIMREYRNMLYRYARNLKIAPKYIARILSFDPYLAEVNKIIDKNSVIQEQENEVMKLIQEDSFGGMLVEYIPGKLPQDPKDPIYNQVCELFNTSLENFILNDLQPNNLGVKDGALKYFDMHPGELDQDESIDSLLADYNQFRTQFPKEVFPEPIPHPFSFWMRPDLHY